MSLWTIICALLEGADGLWRLERELRHWRWTVCFYAAVVLAFILFVAGSGILSVVAFVGMLGVGIWWDW